MVQQVMDVVVERVDSVAAQVDIQEIPQAVEVAAAVPQDQMDLDILVVKVEDRFQEGIQQMDSHMTQGDI